MPGSEKQTSLLFVIIFSQFAGTSLWFAGNAIIDQISTKEDQATITSIVQVGFIAGTLVFSLLNVADRFSSNRVFFLSSLFAALANLLIIWVHKTGPQLSLLRFTTGFFLAGIYPVGMKIAADLFPKKLGSALGFLVGALVLGTAFPHFVRSQLKGIHWQSVLYLTSGLAVFGGLLILLLIPTKPKIDRSASPDLLTAIHVFRSSSFRSAAYGYFGHMWELYAFWSILPLIFTLHNQMQSAEANIYFWSFSIIAIGAIGCAIGGLASQRVGSRQVAYYSLLLSGICCLLAPFTFQPGGLFYFLFLFWGLTVTADSPQFSALVAKNATEQQRGTALTIVTSLGFSITIISIHLLKQCFLLYKQYGLWLLAIGPAFGLLAFKRPNEKQQ